ncbi:MAG: hypothetical protein OEW68_03990 [Gammaproteobacteria bacterium]|nr:hypothetical protein [Gammaproteobacteria bacterium]MDH4313982.1 hypothetical protein [Gammaproteobacteria bacterium]MDH5212716.1 hypothetical protein [Gammaproteobacteria bacterium]MDH5501505.1 hypothetical protein [Gammaproteobacteria bacterium]
MFAFLLQADHARSEATDVTVRVIARNGMYVGDLVHGAFVSITDAASGEMLAQGVTAGGAGNPKRLMKTARNRTEPLAAEGDAKFSATLDLDEPRLLQATAFGPLSQSNSANKASATQWVVPGKHLTGGDGWVLELPGLMVTPNLDASTVPLSRAVNGINIEAEVTLMCGCPIKPGSHWDPLDYEVVAIVRRAEKAVGQYAFRYAGIDSEFETEIKLQLPGIYDIVVYAYDAASGNTGVGRIELTVAGE